MKEILPTPPGIVHNQHARVQELFSKNVMPTYARFDLVFERGQGAHLWDVSGRRYLDLAGGIAVCSLGHANPDITQALVEQSSKLVHVSNLYYTEPQGRLAQKLASLIGPGKCFFCNSGAEANEGLFKLARKFGHDEGRFEIISTLNSFHGRTLAGISATGQEKVKKGFEPMVPGFKHVPFNDLQAMEAAISPATAALLVEGIQGESGITPTRVDYLLGLRRLCDERKLLLLFDGVQCGHFRTGRFTSYQQILEGHPEAEAFMPDAMSMAKSLGGGFPIGAFWVRDKHTHLLSAGTHGTTFGGTPLGCAVALKVLEVIERDNLAQNARAMGDYLMEGVRAIGREFPGLIREVRGHGLIIGIEVEPGHPSFAVEGKSPALHFVNQLHNAGLLTVPGGLTVARLLPPLNLTRAEADEGLQIIRSVIAALA